VAAAHRAVEKDGEAALLAVVETVVERLGGGREFLQVGGAGAQLLRGASEAIDGVDAGGRVVARLGVAALTSLPPGGEARRPLLGEVAHRQFERRPVFLLVGVQLEAGLERGDARVEEGGAVLGAEAAALLLCRIVGGSISPAGERR